MGLIEGLVRQTMRVGQTVVTATTTARLHRWWTRLVTNDACTLLRAHLLCGLDCVGCNGSCPVGPTDFKSFGCSETIQLGTCGRSALAGELRSVVLRHTSHRKARRLRTTVGETFCKHFSSFLAQIEYSWEYEKCLQNVAPILGSHGFSMVCRPNQVFRIKIFACDPCIWECLFDVLSKGVK